MVVLNLGRGGVLWGRPVAGQIRCIPMRAGLTRITLCVPVLGSRGLSPSLSPTLQLGPQGSLCQAESLDHDFPRTLMKGSPDGTVGPDRYFQDTLDLTAWPE